MKWWARTDGHGRQRGEEKVVEHQVHLVDHDGAGESAVDLVPEADENESLKIGQDMDSFYLVEGDEQCDQIWQNFATLAKL